MAVSRIVAIIDDDALVREATGKLLRSYGYAVVLFASAEEFLASGAIESASCVITDVRMTGMSGIELQDRLVASGHRIPMIFMTAFPEKSTEARALSFGALGFFAKPYRAESLIGCVMSALELQA
jgi:FixJ family two-component response regulator